MLKLLCSDALLNHMINMVQAYLPPKEIRMFLHPTASLHVAEIEVAVQGFWGFQVEP